MSLQLPYRSPGAIGPAVEQPRTVRLLRWAAVVAGLTVAGLLLLAAVAIALGIWVSPVLGGLVLLTFILFMPTAVMSIRNVRRRRGMMVLSYLEQAVRLNLPLPEMLTAAARSEATLTARCLGRLRGCLQDGYEVGDAVARSVPEVPDRVISLLNMAEHAGRLPQTLHRVLQEQRELQGRDSSGRAFVWTYPPVVLGVATAITGTIMVFVIPKFRQIFQDFHMPLPPVTQALIGVCATWLPVISLAMALLVLLMMGRAMVEAFYAGSRRWRIGRGMRDWLCWYLPVFGGIARDRGLADICQCLADAIDAGRSMTWALNEAAEVDINRQLQSRVVNWADGVNRGLTIHEAARRAKLPQLLTGMLATGEAASDAGAVFQFLARYYRGRFSRTALLLQAAVLPGATLVCAVLVGFVALGIFRPLVALIEHLAPTSGVL